MVNTQYGCTPVQLIRNSEGFIILYDLSDLQSINSVYDYYQQILEKGLIDNSVILVLGNKSDAFSLHREAVEQMRASLS